MRSDRLARRSSFLGRRIEIVFASEGIDLGRCLLCMLGFVGSMETFGQNVRLRSRRCGVLAEMCAERFRKSRVCQHFDGPLSFAELGGRWACAMTDESAVYSVYAKGIFYI